MYYVYIIRSLSEPSQSYTGATSDLKQRLADHNASRSSHTSKHVPWELEFYAAFADKQRAYAFEVYLKSHSGRAFASKRLVRTTSAPNANESAQNLAQLGGSQPQLQAIPRRRAKLG